MKFKNIAVCSALILSVLSLWGCGSKVEKTESWAYDYEPSQEVLAFYEDGTAVYKGEEYKFSKDDSFISLTKGSDSTKLRYIDDGKRIILYEKSTYQHQNGDADGSIVGLWTQANGWSYQFTEDGSFSEENIFFGHYTVDEENSCIRLMYDDPVEDAYLYYRINGNEMTIDYPWPMTECAG